MNPKAEKTRRVVEVAESLFATKGFDKTTIKEIAREAGVGVGTIYEYFPDKQSLLFAIPAVRIEEMINQLNECLYAVPGAFNKLRKLVHFFLSAYENNVSFARLMYLFMVPYTGWRDSPAYQLARSLTSILTAIVREGQEERLVRTDIDVRLMRTLCLGAIERLTVGWLFSSKSYRLTDASEDLAQLLIDAISKAPELGSAIDCPFLGRQRSSSQTTQCLSMVHRKKQ